MHIDDIPVFKKIERKACTGCEACTNACPIDCITMLQDVEGFYFPSCDTVKCIGCNKCVKACPVLNLKSNNLILESYAGYAKDETIVKKSASGGMFSLLMDAFRTLTDNQGYIGGVVWNSKYTGAEHIVSAKFEDHERMKSSKYIQSRKHEVYKKVKKLLEEEQYVLFSGTPCEVAGLKGFLNKDYEKLITIDIVCQGPTSPKAMEQFITDITKTGKKKIKSVNMRHVKVTPWIPQWINIDFENGKSWCRLFYETTIGRSMHIMQRSSCYRCEFNGLNRCSDITVGDFHGAEVKANYYNPYGTSIVIVNTDKGKILFNNIEESRVLLERVDYDLISIPNPRIIKAGTPHLFRDDFGRIFASDGLKAATDASWSPRQKLRMKIPYSIRLKVREIRKR